MVNLAGQAERALAAPTKTHGQAPKLQLVTKPLAIRWSTGTGVPGEVTVSDSRAERLFARGDTGTAIAPWLQSGKRFRFRLYSVGGRHLLLVMLRVQVGVAHGVHAVTQNAPPRPPRSGRLVNAVLRLVPAFILIVLIAMSGSYFRDRRRLESR